MIGLKQKWKGLVLCLAIALPSWFLGKIFPIVGGAVIAILAGMVLTGFIRHKEHLEPGIKFTSKKILHGPSYFLALG